MIQPVVMLVLLSCGGGGCGSDEDSASPVVIDTQDTAVDDPGTDPLSMPAEPTLSPADFTSAASCLECHPSQYDDWSSSNHAYAMHDPIFRALAEVRQEHLGGEEDLFCTQCHSAIGTRGGDVTSGFAFEDLLDISLEGITCESCHKISSIERTYNAGHVLDPTGPMRGPIEDPEESTFHADVAYEPFFSSSEICGSCHDAVETSGLPLERPYAEWLTSPAFEEGQQCQDCHMPESTGLAATTATTQRTLRSHRFVGVDVPMEGFVDETRAEEIRADVAALLESAASVSLQVPEAVAAGEQLDVVITVRNDIPAHNFPTGSTFLRQAWLEVIATDAAGTQLYVTGDLDKNGDLRDHWSALDPYGDDDLLTFHSNFIDIDGAPTLFTHLATEHTTNALFPLHTRTATLFVPTAAAAQGPITVSVRLRFRSFAPHLLRLLGKDALVEELTIYDIDSVVETVELSGGSAEDTGK